MINIDSVLHTKTLKYKVPHIPPVSYFIMYLDTGLRMAAQERTVQRESVKTKDALVEAKNRPTRAKFSVMFLDTLFAKYMEDFSHFTTKLIFSKALVV